MGFDFAEAGDHAIVAVDEHLRFFASGREEHDVGVGVVPGAHGEDPQEVSRAVAGSDALADVLLPQEAPQRAQPPLLCHRVDIASSVRMQVADSHPSSRATDAAIACASSQSQSQSTSIKARMGQKNTTPTKYGKST